MTEFLYRVVGAIADIHTYLLSLNDSIETSFTDKELHFLIIGILGLIFALIAQPLFQWLANNDHVIVITFIYVLTLIVVITFAIEIGQGYTGTGVMEFGDICYGIAGFVAFFILFALIRALIRLITEKSRR